MIRYSTQPGKGTKTVTDSPTSTIRTTGDVRGLNDSGEDEKSRSLLDMDSTDANDN